MKKLGSEAGSKKGNEIGSLFTSEKIKDHFAANNKSDKKSSCQRL